MTSRALALKFVDRVGLEDAEEAEVVDTTQVLNQEIKLFLLGEQFLIVGLVLFDHAFLFFLAFVHVVVLGLGGYNRLKLATLGQLGDALFDLCHTEIIITHLVVKLADKTSGKLKIALDTFRGREQVPQCLLARCIRGTVESAVDCEVSTFRVFDGLAVHLVETTFTSSEEVLGLLGGLAILAILFFGGFLRSRIGHFFFARRLRIEDDPSHTMATLERIRVGKREVLETTLIFTEMLLRERLEFVACHSRPNGLDQKRWQLGNLVTDVTAT